MAGENRKERFASGSKMSFNRAQIIGDKTMVGDVFVQLVQYILSETSQVKSAIYVSIAGVK